MRRVLEALGIVSARCEGPVDLWEDPLRIGLAPAPGLDEQGLRQLLRLFESAVETGKASHAFEIYQVYLGGYAELGHRRGLMILGERLLRQLAGAGEGRDQVGLPPDLSAAQRFRVAFDWGLFRGALGGLAGEIDCYQAAIAPAADSPLGQVVAWRALAYAERQRGRLRQALIACDLSLEVPRAAGPAEQRLAEQQAVSEALRTRLLHDLGRVAEVAQGGADPQAASGPQWQEPLCGIWQAERALELGQVQICEERSRGVLGNGETRRDSGLIARAHLCLGLSVLRRDPDCAKRHLNQAQGWIDRSDHTELRLLAQELRSRIAGARGQWRSAFFDAFKGLRLAEDCGYGLIRVRLAVLVVRWALQRRAPLILKRSCELLSSALEQGAPDYAWGRADGLHQLEIAQRRLGDASARETLQ